MGWGERSIFSCLSQQVPVAQIFNGLQQPPVKKYIFFFPPFFSIIGRAPHMLWPSVCVDIGKEKKSWEIQCERLSFFLSYPGLLELEHLHGDPEARADEVPPAAPATAPAAAAATAAGPSGRRPAAELQVQRSQGGGGEEGQDPLRHRHPLRLLQPLPLHPQHGGVLRGQVRWGGRKRKGRVARVLF